MKPIDNPIFVHEEAVMGTVAVFNIFENFEVDDDIIDENQLHDQKLGPEIGTKLNPGLDPKSTTRFHLDDKIIMEAVGKACEVLHKCDEIFSTFKEDSPMNQYRRGEITLEDAPREIAEVLEICNELKSATDGWFDPWVMLGGVDPTGMVKGWAEDKALSVLAKSGVKAATLNIGGDIAVLGTIKPFQKWRFGIRHPLYPDSLIRIIETYENLATSANYERPGELIDPYLKMPVDRVASVSVLGPQLAVADAFATAGAVAGSQHLDWIRNQNIYSSYVLLYDGTEIIIGDVSFG